MLELLAVINMLIECSNIKKSFQGIPLLKDITFKVDNHDADMQRLLNNPKLAEVSDKMFNAATNAGLSYPEAATFATTES